jgi:AcrR family transcriptional regulator
MSERTVQTGRRAGHPTKREVIVDSALRLILKNGYDVATMSGVSKGLVSYHFPKKDALFRAVLEKILHRLEDDLRAVHEAELPARERLTLYYRNLFEHEERTRHYYIVLVDFLAQAPREASVRNYTQVIYQTILQYVEMTVADGIVAGEFRNVDARIAAATIVALTEGFIFQWLYNPEGITPAQAQQVAEAYVVEHLLLPPGGG